MASGLSDHMQWSCRELWPISRVSFGNPVIPRIYIFHLVEFGDVNAPSHSGGPLLA